MLIFSTKIEDRIYGFGFGCSGKWYIDGNYFYKGKILEAENELRIATEEEVRQALINEAKKRGFKKGVVFKSIDYTTNKKLKIVSSEFKFASNDLYIGTNDLTKYKSVFKDGKWAEIIS